MKAFGIWDFIVWDNLFIEIWTTGILLFRSACRVPLLHIYIWYFYPNFDSIKNLLSYRLVHASTNDDENWSRTNWRTVFGSRRNTQPATSIRTTKVWFTRPLPKPIRTRSMRRTPSMTTRPTSSHHDEHSTPNDVAKRRTRSVQHWMNITSTMSKIPCKTLTRWSFQVPAKGVSTITTTMLAVVRPV